MDDLDLKLIKLTQDGIDLVPEPFGKIALELAIPVAEVIDRTRALVESGVVRRFGASIGHRVLGIVANAMCVWNVPDDRVEEVGAVMAGFGEVTHCYECERTAHDISRATGISDYMLLFSEREFKKTGVRI